MDSIEKNGSDEALLDMLKIYNMTTYSQYKKLEFH